MRQRKDSTLAYGSGPYDMVRADELRAGDRIVVTVMGGSETVRVEKVTAAWGRVRWHGWSPVMGEVSDTLDAAHTVRIAA